MSFRLVQISVTLNVEMAFILRYFTEFVYDVVVKQLLGLPRFQNLLLIVYDHINTICAVRMWILKTGIRASLTGTGYSSGKATIIAKLIKLRRNLA